MHTNQPSPYSERSGFYSAEIGLAGLLDTEPYGCLSGMPHYKDGTPAKTLDRVKLCTGSTTKDGKTELVYGEGVVLEVVPGATCCELKVFIPWSNAEIEVLGTGTVFMKRPPPNDPKGEPITWHLGCVTIGPGYLSQTNAKDVELVES